MRMTSALLSYEDGAKTAACPSEEGSLAHALSKRRSIPMRRCNRSWITEKLHVNGDKLRRAASVSKL
jgi:hypothetical protein